MTEPIQRNKYAAERRSFFRIDDTVRLSLRRVPAEELEDRLDRLARNVEYRCPVMNLLAAAKVEMEVTWTQKPAAARNPIARSTP